LLQRQRKRFTAMRASKCWSANRHRCWWFTWRDFIRWGGL